MLEIAAESESKRVGWVADTLAEISVVCIRNGICHPLDSRFKTEGKAGCDSVEQWRRDGESIDGIAQVRSPLPTCSTTKCEIPLETWRWEIAVRREEVERIDHDVCLCKTLLGRI